jgi:hypothetical protein
VMGLCPCLPRGCRRYSEQTDVQEPSSHVAVVGYPGSVSRRRSSWNGEAWMARTIAVKTVASVSSGGCTDIPCHVGDRDVAVHGPVPSGR